jgi:hypothetical protein
MSELDDWTAAVAVELELSQGVDRDLILGLARDVAHAVARPAAPLTTYLLGLAVGAGADPGAAAASIRGLAEGWDPDREPDPATEALD